MNIDILRFGQDGLIPAIVQDFYSGKVLMLAYMNHESLLITEKEGYTCFFSRSRGKLWRKGESSGNRQRVQAIKTDCDRDTLLITVIKEGPACHTGAESCFFEPLVGTSEGFSIEGLYELLADRMEKLPQGSYTTYLFEKGREKILKKVGEESSEVIIGAMKGDKQETIAEISDLCYHVLVLMNEMGIKIDDIKKELASRHIIDKKTKQ